MTKAWQGDWHERIMQRVHNRGFETVTAFTDTSPTTSLMTLADDLGKDDVAAVQVQRMLVFEAEETGTIERCARSLLVRRLHEELPEGWHAEWDDVSSSGPRFRRAGAYGSWCAAFPDCYERSYRGVWDALVALPIPEGWLPANRDDPILLEAFKHWAMPA